MHCEPLIKKGLAPLSESSEKKGKKSKHSPFWKGAIFFLPIAIATSLLLYSLHVPFPSPKRPLILYDSAKGLDLSILLKTCLKRANRSIALYSYALNDTSLLPILRQQANSGVAISVVCDKKGSIHPAFLTEQFPIYHRSLHGISGKNGLIHEKIWIIDEEYIFLGSANLTPSSLKLHQNMMIGLYAPDLAHTRQITRVPHIETTIPGYKINYFSLPTPQALPALIETIKQARKTIELFLFTFTHKELAQALMDRQQQGVKVTVYLDKTSAYGASHAMKEELSAHGIRCILSKGRELFHYKWCVIDKKIHIIGSANWTKSAFEKNEDFICILTPNKEIR